MNKYYPQFNIFADAFDVFKHDVFKQHPHDDNDITSLYPEALRRVVVHGSPTITNLGRVQSLGDYVKPTDEYDMI